MSQNNLLCVIDTETTGLPEDPDAAVIEVAASIWDMSRGEEVRCWSTLVKPLSWGNQGKRIALEVNGIDPELVEAHGEDPVMALMRLLDFAKNLPLHAWNRSFDEEMVRRMDPRERRLSREDLWGPCLMREFSVVARGDADLRSKLQFAYEQCGFPFHEESAHRALADARMSARCIHHIRSGGKLERKGWMDRPKPEPVVPHENAGKRKWTRAGFVDTAGGAA
jgi:DNA polymerase III alpha subunit (gram-positive type)